LNDILEKNYSSVSEDAWAALNKHRSENCDGEDAVIWLKQGLEINKSACCPYCGQSLDPAKDLVDAYQKIFDVKFDEYETALKARIDTLRANIRSLTVFSPSGLISSFIKSAEPFNPYVPEIEEQIKNARTDIDSMTIEEQAQRNALVLWQAEADELLKSKEKSVHKSLKNTSNHKHVDDTTSTLVASNTKLIAITQDITKHIENTQDKINKYTPEVIADEIAKYKKSIADYSKKIARIEQEDEALEYIQKVKDINTLAKKIKEETLKLETEQSLYLESYFVRVNHWLTQLGSTGFKIERDTKNNGDKKVYSLKLEFNGQKIRPEDINKVFSESDRRNLAFSVFMARAEKMPKKDEIILVMDDPVVSFDDNRIEKTCREIKLISSQYRQIIILTHYKYLLHGLIKNQTDACYVDVEPLPFGSALAVKDVSTITMTAHEKACDRICAFIDGNNDAEIMSVLRPFIEEHLNFVFQKQIRDNDWKNVKLSELIDNIHGASLIIDDTKERLHALRISLNNGHHNTDSEENVESIRSDARDVVSLLYAHIPERSVA
jgi:wobble nucleotide-excising tRNase